MIRLIWKCRVNVTVHVASLDNFDFVVAMVRRDILIRFHAIHLHNVCRGPDHNRGETLLPCQFLSSILADWSRWHLCLLANYSFLFWKKRIICSIRIIIRSAVERLHVNPRALPSPALAGGPKAPGSLAGSPERSIMKILARPQHRGDLLGSACSQTSGQTEPAEMPPPRP